MTNVCTCPEERRASSPRPFLSKEPIAPIPKNLVSNKTALILIVRTILILLSDTTTTTTTTTTTNLVSGLIMGRSATSAP